MITVVSGGSVKVRPWARVAILLFATAAPDLKIVGADAPTFTRDVGPLLYKSCLDCHRPGQGAPFSLVSYQDARKHAADIVTVTSARTMPPWPPGSDYDTFQNSRALSSNQITLLRTWVETGMAEGAPGDLPPLPTPHSGWQLGQPDLIVTLPQPYKLAAEGKDTYRNFVLQVPLGTNRFVRAVEFNPGNAACVHHAFVKLARTPAARRLDGHEDQPGFGGLMLPEGVEMPEGHFLTWQPGKITAAEDPRFAWRLDPGNDLVLQLHMRSTGKPESVQPSVALYFSDRTPTVTPFKFALASLAIDLPPGAADAVIKDTWTLPAGLRLLRVLPHAHYLGHDLQGYATLPDGTRRWLVRIQDWDFNWQGDYVYREPIELPAGTVVTMEYHYDNSTNNVRNPNSPPRRVQYGPGSADEMAELWFQALPLAPASLPLLQREYNNKMGRLSRDYAEFQLARDPANVPARINLATYLLGTGRREQARAALQKALEYQPENEQAHYLMGVLYRTQNRLAEARTEFERAIKANPNYGKAHGNLGIVLAGLGERESAVQHLETALRIDPEDTVAKNSLEAIRQKTR